MWVNTIIALLLVIIAIALWRYRQVLLVKRQLEARLALKNQQLFSQSRALSLECYQIRKQLKMRSLLYAHTFKQFNHHLNQTKQKLSVTSAPPLSPQDIQQELAWLAPSYSSAAQPIINLTLVINIALNLWQPELQKAGINLDATLNQELFVCLKCFNLDVLFNQIFAALLRCSRRDQKIKLELIARDKQVVFCLHSLHCSAGSKFDIEHGLETLTKLAAQSGAELNLSTANEDKRLEIRWPQSAFIAQDNSQNSGQKHSQEGESELWLAKVTKLVECQYHDAKFGTSVAAKMLYMSERNLQRRFKVALGKTFTEYLTEVRLAHACEFLLAGEKVSQAAFECGFKGASYFSYKFKQHFNLSPTQFVTLQNQQQSEVLK